MDTAKAAFIDELSKLASNNVPSSTLGQLVDGLTGGANRRVKRAINKIDGNTEGTNTQISNRAKDTASLIARYENM